MSTHNIIPTNIFINKPHVPHSEDLASFINNMETLISKSITLFNLLVDEEETDFEDDTILYSEYQLSEIESVLLEMDLASIQTIKEMLLSDTIDNERIRTKLIKGSTRLIRALKRLQVNCDRFIPLSTSEVTEYQDTFKKGLGDLIYGYCNVMDLADAYKQITNNDNVHLQAEYVNFCKMRNIDPVEHTVQLIQLSRKEFITILDIFESQPEVWNRFIQDVPEQFVEEILDYAEFVKISDITNFNTGKLIIDDDYIQLLRARDLASAEEDVSEEENMVTTNLFTNYDF